MMPPLSSSSSSSSSSSVLSTITSTASKAAIFAGSVYLVRGYITERLEDVKEKLESERIAKDTIRRRFEQTREDVGYTVVAMLPELAEGILEELDVEEVTKELKGLGKEREKEKEKEKTSSVESSQLNTSGLRSWVDTGSNNEDSPEMSSSIVSANSNGTGYGYTTSSIAASASTSNLSDISSALSATGSGSGGDAESDAGSASSSGRRGLYETNNASGSMSSLPSLGTSSLESSAILQPTLRHSHLRIPKTLHPKPPFKSKSALWQHLLQLTLTRTLLVSYTIPLLSLFTSLQLTLLARAKYVRGIMQKAKEEEIRERIEESVRKEFGWKNVMFGVIKTKLGFGGDGLDLNMGMDLDWRKQEELYDVEAALSNPNERGIHSAPDLAFDALSTKYLTLSYHLLHVGWRELAEVVQGAVVATLQEFYIVHEGEGGRKEEKVTLKTKLTQRDVQRLVRTIRKRVEGRLWDLSGEDDGDSLPSSDPSGQFHLQGMKWIWTEERVRRERAKREMLCRVLLPRTKQEIGRTLIEGGWRGDLEEYGDALGYEEYRREVLEEPSSPSVSQHGEPQTIEIQSSGSSVAEGESSPAPSFSQISEESSQLSAQDHFQTSHLELRAPVRPLPVPNSASGSYAHPLPAPPTSSKRQELEEETYSQPEPDVWPNDRSRYSIISMNEDISSTSSPVTEFSVGVGTEASVPKEMSRSSSRSRQEKLGSGSVSGSISVSSSSLSRPESRSSNVSSLHSQQGSKQKLKGKEKEKESTPPPPQTNHSLYPFPWPSSSSTAPSPRDPDPAFTALLDETRTLLMSADFAFVFGKAVGAVLRGVVGEEVGEGDNGEAGVLSRCFVSSTEVVLARDDTSTKEGEKREKEQGKARLAALLPPLAHWSKDSLVGLPNVVVDEVLGMREVKAWEGIVFGEF
ncbi:peroxin [Stygiomarasmius scandens]|uniref:Peroxin n=1 Tax=Marasmiellus scandens TaxID=2682957 RepID=A0ABR1K595_9AGAR